MKTRKIIFSVLLAVFLTLPAFSQPEVLKGVVNNLARYKNNKEIKHLAAAKKSIDSLIALNNDTTNFEKNILLAVANSSILYYDSLNSLGFKPELLNQTTKLFDKLITKEKRKDFKPEIKFISDCLANVNIRNAFNSLKRSDILSAHQQLLNARKFAPDFDYLKAYQAQINSRLGNLQSAASLYEELKMSGNLLNENVETASAVYKAIGDTSKAINLLVNARKQLSENNFILLDEANIYNNKHQYASLVNLIPALLDINPNNSGIAFIAANCYDRLGRYEEAESLYLRATDLNSSAYEPAFNLGLLYLKKAIVDNTNEKYVSLAKKWIEKAHEIAPENSGNLKALRLVYTILGNTSQLNSINNNLRKFTN